MPSPGYNQNFSAVCHRPYLPTAEPRPICPLLGTEMQNLHLIPEAELPTPSLPWFPGAGVCFPPARGFIPAVKTGACGPISHISAPDPLSKDI